MQKRLRMSFSAIKLFCLAFWQFSVQFQHALGCGMDEVSCTILDWPNTIAEDTKPIKRQGKDVSSSDKGDYGHGRAGVRLIVGMP